MRPHGVTSWLVAIAISAITLLAGGCGESDRSAPEAVSEPIPSQDDSVDPMTAAGLKVTKRFPKPLTTDPSRATTPEAMYDLLRHAAEQRSGRAIYALLDSKTQVHLTQWREAKLLILKQAFDTGDLVRQEYNHKREIAKNTMVPKDYFVFAHHQQGAPDYPSEDRCRLPVYPVGKGGVVNKATHLELYLVRENGLWRLSRDVNNE